MRESRTYGSVRGALSNGRPYRDRALTAGETGPGFPLRFKPGYASTAIAGPCRGRHRRIRLVERRHGRISGE